jgi:succinyl-CoA synthetase alpha subunit
MLKKHRIRKNHYSDSVALMRVAADLEMLPGIFQATAIMATEANLELARAVDLVDDFIEAQPNNLLIAVIAQDETAAAAAFAQAEMQMENVGSNGDSYATIELEAKSIAMSVERDPELNLALISCPGDYAAAEAKKALNLGLHVMLFSDNVSVEEEVEIKTIGLAKDLLVMGPDCGTAIINGLPLGFANVVADGPVGIVAASGTGLQQVSSLLSQWGTGISQGIGTGGRDLNAEVGGISMVQGLDVLLEDDQTEVIVLVSKPPSDEVAEKILGVAQAGTKPVIACFLGYEYKKNDNIVQFARTLDDAAELAYAKVNNGNAPTRMNFKIGSVNETFDQNENQKYVRGVYSGGTFCYEAQFILRDFLGPVWSSTPVEKAFQLKDSWTSQEHTIIDLGDDEFTQGRPHPMIDHRTRHERILQEAADPETAVILFDVVIGYGSHANPAAEILISIEGARNIAAKEKRQIYFVGFVCGTDLDPQKFTMQIETLKSAGVHLAESNTNAARLAASLIVTQSSQRN